MTEPRTITLDTQDRGPVTFTDPVWCTNDHEEADAPASRRTLRQSARRAWRIATGRRPRRIDRRPWASEIHHVGAPVDFTVTSASGDHLLLALMLWQDAFPNPSYEYGSEVYVVAQVDADYIGFPLDGLDSLSADLMEAAQAVRLAARDLAATADGGEGRD